MTGIQNSPEHDYQLMAVKESKPEYLAKAKKMLMIPDYFHYRITGKTVTEYTNATTTQPVDPKTKDWNWDLIQLLKYPKIFFSLSDAAELVNYPKRSKRSRF